MSSKKFRYVIHEHHAKRAGIHWDIRLQYKKCKHGNDISLYSFATRKMLEFYKDKIKKIAVFRTPDHECWWLTFEGELKQGYGAGDIYIWDYGEIIWIKDEDNKKVFTLNGKRFKNITLALIKVKNISNADTWLLIRVKKESSED